MAVKRYDGTQWVTYAGAGIQGIAGSNGIQGTTGLQGTQGLQGAAVQGTAGSVPSGTTTYAEIFMTSGM